VDSFQHKTDIVNQPLYRSSKDHTEGQYFPLFKLDSCYTQCIKYILIQENNLHVYGSASALSLGYALCHVPQ